MTTYQGWEIRHEAAMLNPTAAELPIVALITMVGSFTDRWRDDYVTREGVVDLIKGARVLLNWDWGNRLQMGPLSELLEKAAEELGYDLDVEKFLDNRSTHA